MMVNRATREPDWSDSGIRYSAEGWRADMPRRYPSPTGEGRPVRVSFFSWVGTALGAKHTRARVDSRPCPVWTGEEWALFRDDPERDEESVEEAFVLEARAHRFAVRTVERRFPAPAWSAQWPEDFDPASVQPDADEDAAVVACKCCGKAVGEHESNYLASCKDILAGGPGTVGEPAVEVRCLVDAGPVSGSVGDEVCVLHDMHPSNVVLLFGCRALLVENGGAAVHLAQVARERGVTVLLVPDALVKYPRGTWVNVSPGPPASVNEG